MTRTKRDDPIRLAFLAGCALAACAGEVFALRYTSDVVWKWNLALASLFLALALVLSAMAIGAAVGQGHQLLMTVSLVGYWFLAFVGLLVMALANDPIPFLSTLVAAIISVLVAWVIQNHVPHKGLDKPHRPGWWTTRRFR